jgi:hypothetical protein
LLVLVDSLTTVVVARSKTLAAASWSAMVTASSETLGLAIGLAYDGRGLGFKRRSAMTDDSLKSGALLGGAVRSKSQDQ